MGFNYRKSFKAGPIRITASKSGISYSAGVKGARITKRADGRVQTTLSAPGTGLRYTATSGGKRSSKAATAPSGPSRAELTEARREVYEATLQALRDGVTADEIRARSNQRGTAVPAVLKAIKNAERTFAKEAKTARYDALARLAAEQLRSGMPRLEVDKWLKTEHRVGWWQRAEVMTRAKKLAGK